MTTTLIDNLSITEDLEEATYIMFQQSKHNCDAAAMDITLNHLYKVGLNEGDFPGHFEPFVIDDQGHLNFAPYIMLPSTLYKKNSILLYK